ncbi:MAG: hypothetical protein M3Q07_24375 [Pseudobdellovibrionaceae bacterium]|nr:hypothetical protein [Pseudobdellovibrionaceae bacterium]
MQFEEAIEVVLDIEGPIADRDKTVDPGGLTNWGISIRAFPWLGEDGIRSLTRQSVKPLYREHYWNAAGADSLPPYLRLLVFDFAVHSHPKVAAKQLQECLNRMGMILAVDGTIGPKTLKAIGRVKPKIMIEEYQHERQVFLRSLRNYKANARGWEKRVLRVLIENFQKGFEIDGFFS